MTMVYGPLAQSSQNTDKMGKKHTGLGWRILIEYSAYKNPGINRAKLVSNYIFKKVTYIKYSLLQLIWHWGDSLYDLPCIVLPNMQVNKNEI